MVLVGSGGVSHAALVDLASTHFGSLPVSSTPIPLGGSTYAPTNFVGSEVRVRDDTMSTAHIAIAVEGVGWNSPDYYSMLVMQSIFGNWDRSLGGASLLSSKLSHIISSNNLANSFMSFSTSYSDTGLWGIYLVSENIMNLDDLTHFTMKEWQRMSTAPTETEVGRAKAQLKASLLLGLDGTTAVAEDIGRQIVTSGKRLTPAEIEAKVDAVGVEDIQRVAQKYLWDKDVRDLISVAFTLASPCSFLLLALTQIAIAAVGRIEGLLDYSRELFCFSYLSFTSIADRLYDQVFAHRTPPFYGRTKFERVHV